MAQGTSPALELTDIQGNVIRSYSMPFARYFFLAVTDAAKAKTALKQVIPLVTSAEEWDEKPEYTFNLAFNYNGLAALGVSADALALFVPEFQKGMKSQAGILGDTGVSSPSNWEPALAGSNLHIMVALYSKTSDARESQSTQLRNAITESGGLLLLYEQDCAVLTEGREHFGFEDGMSQPSVAGDGLKNMPGQGTPQSDGTWKPLQPGEFVLGYPDEAGEQITAKGPHDLRINGSYLVVRKLKQNVTQFRTFIQQTADQYFGDTSAAMQEQIAAKMIGRWRSGAPMSLTPEKDDPTLAADESRNNDFRFGKDPVGYGCPRGSHIRRCNPRDALDGTSTVVRRHRMMRRGIAYGPMLPPGAKDDGVDRGLFFVAAVADIQRQFQFVQQQWVNRGDFADLDMAEKDAIIGNNNNDGQFSIPSEDMPHMVFDLPRFVVTRGGDYFFLPGIRALGQIAGS